MARHITYDGQGNVVEQLDVADDPRDVNERSITDQAEAALADLRLVRDSTGTLTGAQLSNAARLFARVLIGIIRVLLRKFDAAD